MSVHAPRAALAERGWGQMAPNPMVGAVVVAATARSSARACTALTAAQHAEVVALAGGRRARPRRDALRHARALRPPGETPPCADAIIARRRRAASSRPSAIPTAIARGGVERLERAGIVADAGGVRRERRVELNAPFFHALRHGSPLGHAQARACRWMAPSPTARKPCGWITGDESRAGGAPAAREARRRSRSAWAPCSPTIRRSPFATYPRRACRPSGRDSRATGRLPVTRVAGADRSTRSPVIVGGPRARDPRLRTTAGARRGRRARRPPSARRSRTSARGIRSLLVERGPGSRARSCARPSSTGWRSSDRRP